MDSVKPARRNAEIGQALILVTLGLTFLFGLLGLVVDVGYGYYLRQVAQAAADAAAMAGATNAKTTGSYCGHDGCQTGYSCPSDPTNATNIGVACLYAKADGGQNVTLSEGTGLSASGANTTYWITANVSQTDTPRISVHNGIQWRHGLVSGYWRRDCGPWRRRLHLCPGPHSRSVADGEWREFFYSIRLRNLC
jgi:hypothetical protein